jgi:hypothetical protein
MDPGVDVPVREAVARLEPCARGEPDAPSMIAATAAISTTPKAAPPREYRDRPQRDPADIVLSPQVLTPAKASGAKGAAAPVGLCGRSLAPGDPLT